MSSVPAKKSCVKCVRGAGIVTCDGCHQSFCHKHLSEHRKELLDEVNQLNNQCKHFQGNLAQENDPAPLLTAIDNWEEQSVQKIRSVAETARTEVRQLTEKTINNFSQILNKITTKMESSRETDDVTEVDLIKWKDELQALKNLLKKPFPIGLTSDENPTSIIRFIKVKYESPFLIQSSQSKGKSNQITVKKEVQPSKSQQSTVNMQEKFSRVAGHATLSDHDSIVTFVGYSSVAGIKQYGTGIHRIRFEIIDKRNEGIFFGILTSEKEITARASELPSVYGWRDFNRVIINGNAQLKAHQEKNIEADDQLTLTIDCDHPKLILTHHQLKQKVQMPVDIDKCPLPWKLILSSFGEDIIAILN